MDFVDDIVGKKVKNGSECSCNALRMKPESWPKVQNKWLQAIAMNNNAVAPEEVKKEENVVVDEKQSQNSIATNDSSIAKMQELVNFLPTESQEHFIGNRAIKLKETSKDEKKPSIERLQDRCKNIYSLGLANGKELTPELDVKDVSENNFKDIAKDINEAMNNEFTLIEPVSPSEVEAATIPVETPVEEAPAEEVVQIPQEVANVQVEAAKVETNENVRDNVIIPEDRNATPVEAKEEEVIEAPIIEEPIAQPVVEEAHIEEPKIEMPEVSEPVNVVPEEKAIEPVAMPEPVREDPIIPVKTIMEPKVEVTDIANIPVPTEENVSAPTEEIVMENNEENKSSIIKNYIKQLEAAKNTYMTLKEEVKLAEENYRKSEAEADKKVAERKEEMNDLKEIVARIQTTHDEYQREAEAKAAVRDKYIKEAESKNEFINRQNEAINELKMQKELLMQALNENSIEDVKIKGK